MDWRPRVYWALLAIVVSIISAMLTRWITHVDRSEKPVLDIVVTESDPLRIDEARPSISALNVDRFRLPRIVMADYGEVLLVVTPGTRSVAFSATGPRGVECGYLDRVVPGASAEYWVNAVRGKPLQSIAAAPGRDGGLLVVVPPHLRASMANVPEAQAAIACRFPGPIATATTFTERAMTVHARNGTAGLLVIDVSALEDIDNLRFSGGIAVPFAGERTRFLDRHDNIVSAEWSSVSAQEQRDIVLVLIGGLAAIAAAMAIEAIRPLVEKKS